MRRQGDILFIKVERVPKGKVKKNGVIAEGEKTGHLHQLVQGTLLEHLGAMYIKVAKEAQVTHNEHKTITLPKGNYLVRRQREFDGIVRD